MEAAVAFVESVGPAVVKAHNDRLIDRMFARLAVRRRRAASPRDAARRGPYGCFRARTAGHTKPSSTRSAKQRVVVSLREGNIRVSPYLYNTPSHIDRLVEIVEAQLPALMF